MAPQQASENWSSRFGVIMAVAGSAVGLGNFLRFPGQAAQYGGGAFMIAYFVSLLIIGVSICWAEWTLGRWGGKHGFHSSPAIIGAIIGRPWGRYVGVLGVLIPVGVYMYYVYIEAWCLGYAVQFVTGNVAGSGDYAKYFAEFVGANKDGFALELGWDKVGIFVLVVYLLNFALIYRGLARGIELFCKYAMPALIVIALVVVVRVLTLPHAEGHPEQSVMNGLGYTWNPGKPVVERLDKGEWRTIELLPNEGFIPAREATLAADGSERIRKPSTFANLLRPQLWLAAAGQIFFSLSVGFGVIITYASYLREKDDVVLSGLTATSTNEFCEVGLGGLMTLPAAFVFLGSAGMAGLSGFGIGFVVLPQVFATMHAGALFGFLFFFLLFLAAVTSSLSMLQPGIAFIEEALGVGRKVSLAILGLVTAIGTLFVWYFSENTKALDTIDFWVGTALIYVQGTILIILFSWVVGVDRGIEEAHKGAAIRIPGWFRPIMKFVCPVFLLVILFAWLTLDVLGWNGSVASAAFDPSAPIKDLIGTTDHPASGVARLSVAGIIVVTAFFLFLIQLGGKRWDGVPKPGGAS